MIPIVDERRDKTQGTKNVAQRMDQRMILVGFHPTTVDSSSLMERIVRLFCRSSYRNTSKTIMYGSKSLGGGGFIRLYTLQSEGQIQHFLKFWRTESDIHDMLEIDLAWCQYEAGISTPILEDTSIHARDLDLVERLS